METASIRREIHEYVDEADEHFLALVHSMVQVEKRSKNRIPALSKEDMIRRAEQSELEIAEGKTINANQFNAGFQQWKQEKKKAIR